ncbi:MAG: 50S ribosomal protein L21 [Crocinitomicaceae bacterium]|nr:50S ribosomal protein L21 [Crocinitomicaceae bacterium]|tara:strand:+ start:16453 stop:17013 length:561 start_codon:yes stop_codon:yes gene_type:complete
MYAIVEIAGQQFKVQKDQQLFVHRLDAKEGDKMSFDKVMLTDDNGKVTVGAPVIEGVAVNAKVVKHLKGDKVLVFKKKRRKGYQKSNGHRQYFTELLVEGIGAAKKKAAAPKKEAKVEKAPATEAKKAAVKKAAPKKAAAKPAASTSTKATGGTQKKTAAPKAEAKKKAAPKKAAAKKKDETKKED